VPPQPARTASALTMTVATSTPRAREVFIENTAYYYRSS
jgi:hypothetical protein